MCGQMGHLMRDCPLNVNQGGDQVISQGTVHHPVAQPSTVHNLYGYGSRGRRSYEGDFDNRGYYDRARYSMSGYNQMGDYAEDQFDTPVGNEDTTGKI